MATTWHAWHFLLHNYVLCVGLSALHPLTDYLFVAGTVAVRLKLAAVQAFNVVHICELNVHVYINHVSKTELIDKIKLNCFLFLI